MLSKTESVAEVRGVSFCEARNASVIKNTIGSSLSKIESDAKLEKKIPPV